ncbi:MAG: hypothetical protein WKF65_08420 [Gaiellaceae bacterium]
MGIRWYEAEPAVFERERAAMAEHAPEMVWVDEGAGGWEGLAPEWPFPRNRPDPGLTRLLGGARLHLRVEYVQAHPAVAPVVVPVSPIPSRERRLRHDWHVNGDGTLCLLAADILWRTDDTAADLVLKASGWIIEYRLKERGLIESMSETGLYDDAGCDNVIRTAE